MLHCCNFAKIFNKVYNLEILFLVWYTVISLSFALMERNKAEDNIKYQINPNTKMTLKSICNFEKCIMENKQVTHALVIYHWDQNLKLHNFLVCSLKSIYLSMLEIDHSSLRLIKNT